MELDDLTFLNALTLTEYTASEANAPTLVRRNKLIAKLSEQLKLATDSDYKPVKLTWHKDGEGREHRIEVPKRVKRWWTDRSDGTVLVTVRYGSKPLELAKGKNAIVVKSLAELPTLLRHLKTAAEQGEFDAVIESSVVGRKLVFKKTAK